MRLTYYFFILSFMLLSSCETEPMDNLQKPSNSSDIIIQIDSNKASAIKSDPYELRYITRHSNILKIHVGYSGGCKHHSFLLRWSGKWNISSPDPTAELYLIHNGNDDSCEAYILETFTVDLDQLFPRETPVNALFTFINPSESPRIIQFSKDSEWVVQSNDCILNLELKQVTCGTGLFHDKWFSINAQKHLQPVQSTVETGLDTHLKPGRYQLGVEILYGYQYPYDANCLAYPGNSLPARITCLSKLP